MSAESASTSLRSLLDKPGISPDLISLEEQLAGYRDALLSRLGTDYPGSPPAEDALIASIRDGRPMIGLVDPLPDATLLNKAAEDLAAILRESIPGARPLVEWIGALSEESRAESLGRWFTVSWKGDPAGLQKLAALAGTDADLLHWCGRHLARPFFHALGRLIRERAALAEDRVLVAGCPSCGGAPRLSHLEQEEGRRYLWCDLCDIEWTFPRITCPFCLNRDHTKLGYLTIDELEKHRIDVCGECHGYLRAIDLRGLPADESVAYFIEDVGSFQLCMVAEREGYRPGSVSGRAVIPVGTAQVSTTGGTDRA